jgi:hypothetical protein
MVMGVTIPFIVFAATEERTGLTPRTILWSGRTLWVCAIA